MEGLAVRGEARGGMKPLAGLCRMRRSVWELPPPRVGRKARRGFGMNLTGVFHGLLSVCPPVSEQESGVEESTGHETLDVDSV